MTKYEIGDKLELKDGRIVIFKRRVQGGRLFVHVPLYYDLYIPSSYVKCVIPTVEHAKEYYFYEFRKGYIDELL